MNESYLMLWGKTSKSSDKLHPALFHMLDAGEVATELWKSALPESFKQDMADKLSLDSESAGRLISWWVSLHDLGKASPSFQTQYQPAEAILTEIGFTFLPRAAYNPSPHGLVTGWAICSENLIPGLDEEETEALARVLSGHHGTWPDNDTFDQPSRGNNLGSKHWKDARKSICGKLADIFNPPTKFIFPKEGLERNIFLTLLSGLVSVADWLASMELVFPAEGLGSDLQAYFQVSAQRAKDVVSDQGWLLWNDPNNNLAFTFQSAFPKHPNPLPLQQAVFDAAYEADLPAMALIEAPTGIGKTEIALMLADHWLKINSGRGLYIAMPTQATSNQMYDRVSDFLTKRYSNERVHLQLAHGHALLDSRFDKTILSNIGDTDQTDGIVAAGWFLPRKRTLLAPYGVGTVDQIFLSVLQTRHFFVRLFGLYGKVIIFDEVHAYDAYQSEIFTRLLGWLRALKISVILLSATLPANVRRQMVAAYAGSDRLQQEDEHSYPRLTMVTSNGSETHKLPPSLSKPVNIEWIGKTPGEVAEYLSKKLENGGCAAVICNTVARAQMMYQAVKESNVAPGNTHLFHARFPYIWRKEMEEMILNQYGPTGERPQRSVVIATQVIEQSLDLDFDIMVSELAPIDLLIQRAGRLHRHANHARPPLLMTPCLVLMEAAMTPDGDPDFGPSSYVYRHYHLLRTQAVLANRSCLQLPEQTPELIEMVYGDIDLELNDQIASLLQKARDEMDKKIQESTRQARYRLIFPPDRDDFLTACLENLDEEATDLHTAFQALTREAPPGTNLVCLHRLENGQIVLDPDNPETLIDIEHEPVRDQVKDFLRCVVQVQRPDIVQYFNNQPKLDAWKKVAALRYHHIVVFEHGRARLEGTPLILCLDRKLGLSFQKEVL